MSRTVCRLLNALGVLMLGFGVAAAQSDATPKVKLTTSLGDITIEVDQAKAPVTVENFLAYVESGYYKGTIFHRVIPGFMIQGGGLDSELSEKVEGQRPPIKNEAGNGLENKRGTVAMARTSVPDSATSQFFINVKDNAFLDQARARDGVGYAVFGRVVDGMDVVDKIEAVKTEARGMHRDVPVAPVVITDAVIVSEPKPAAEAAAPMAPGKGAPQPPKAAAQPPGKAVPAKKPPEEAAPAKQVPGKAVPAKQPPAKPDAKVE